MRKNIEIGGRDIELEANLGTAAFYQELTGYNLFEISSRIAKMMTDAVKTVTANKPKASKSELKVDLIGSGIGEASSLAVETAEALAYIMNLQTQFGKTKEDIYKIREKLTKDDQLEWMMSFSPESFTYKTYTEIMSFWKAQSKETSIEKN